jgi:hypothetical protein
VRSGRAILLDTFAFPSKQKEPIGDAEHVREAVARFNQAHGVTDSERGAAWRRIREKFGVASRYSL